MRRICFSLSRLASGIIFSILLLGVANAKDDGTDPSATLEKEIQANVINADGSFVETCDLVWRINEARAIGALAQQSLSYNRTLETLDVITAYTQKPDGRKVVVQADQIKDQQERQSADAPMFQDTRVKVVIFSEVTVGDRLVLQYKRSRTTAMFPGQFDDLSYRGAYAYKQFTLIYDLPASLPLYADAKGFAASTPAAAPGRKIYQWDYVPGDKPRVEQGAVSYLDYGPYLAVSTFADFGAFAHAYDLRARDKAAVTPKIAKLANTLTAKLSNPRAKALVLENWVRNNIRYVAVYVGDGGVVPHAADTILDNRYGDCKDHATMLEALLTAVGIDSTPALIGASNAYVLPKVPTLGIINHVITYIPSLNLYLDSTAGSIGPGYLPPNDLDKPVVLTKLGTLAHTPATQTGNTVNTMVFKVAASGAADFTQSTYMTGWQAELNRAAIRSIKLTDRDLLVQRLLTSLGQNGTGTLDAGRLNGIGNDYEFKMAGHTENLVNLPGPIGVPALSSFTGGIAQTVFAASTEKERTQAFICVSQGMDEESRFEFPKTMHIVATPEPVSVHDANFDYTADYVREANAITINRHYKSHYSGMVCSPDRFKSMQPVLDTMIRDVRSQIVVQATASEEHTAIQPILSVTHREPLTNGSSTSMADDHPAAATIDMMACKPEYPRASVLAKETGTVKVQFEIGADEQVISARIVQSSGFQNLDNATVNGLSRCRFKPAYKDGKTVQSTFTAEYIWKLDEPQWWPFANKAADAKAAPLAPPLPSDDLNTRLERAAKLVDGYRKSAEQGDTAAQNQLGDAYRFGRGIDKDYGESLKWYRKSAEQGNAKGQLNFGYMYERGYGIGKDENEAVKWYRKAAEQGDVIAQNNLGIMYSNGRGVDKDDAEAVKWYRKAAEQGNANSQLSLGYMIEMGHGTDKDEVQATIWYRKSADQGNTVAQNNLGIMYQNGRGVDKDFAEAIKWYRKAAAQDNATAENNLGVMYRRGYGVEKDNAEAVKWYLSAANQGYAVAQNNLGDMYRSGYGVAKDEDEAAKWYRKAAAQGNANAVATLKTLGIEDTSEK